MMVFFIFRPRVFEYMRDGEELVEAPFKRLIEANELLAYRHTGFWRPMDTLKDKQILENIVEQGKMPWLDHVGDQSKTVSVDIRTAV